MAERELWLAVINTAMQDAAYGVSGETPENRKRLRQQARDWIAKDNWDFRLVCQYAGVEPQAVREAFREKLAKRHVR